MKVKVATIILCRDCKQLILADTEIRAVDKADGCLIGFSIHVNGKELEHECTQIRRDRRNRHH